MRGTVPPRSLPKICHCILLNNSFLTGFFPFFFFCTLHTHARWITSFLRIFLTLLTPLQIQGGLCRRVLGSRCKFCNQNLKHWKFTSSIYFLAYLSSSVKEKKLCVFFNQSFGPSHPHMNNPGFTRAPCSSPHSDWSLFLWKQVYSKGLGKKYQGRRLVFCSFQYSGSQRG